MSSPNAPQETPSVVTEIPTLQESAWRIGQELGKIRSLLGMLVQIEQVRVLDLSRKQEQDRKGREDAALRQSVLGPKMGT